MTDIATIKFGSDVLEITNPQNIQPASADLFTECRLYAGNVVCLSFACIVGDGDSKPRAEIVTRMRLTLLGAADLRNALDGLLKTAMPGKETAN